ncbi:hypothetical protein VNO80_05667 [Phaseolus coccineus]|uniref:Neprosin PEP catalytic domain-containing protein n=1 Tax=Phaseolus coccineus TaxID=3886 RepID=A0AAN9NKB2_PHACN
MSHIWVQNESTKDAVNKISVGWHSDNYKKTGCYNLYCLGFVQIHPQKYIGSQVDQTSIYDGTMIELIISITQDPDTENWWINYQGENIGYFPSKLFSNMNSADQVGWGGRTMTPPNTPAPPMGSGYFPDRNFAHACYFKHISFQNASRSDYGPTFDDVGTFNDNPNCFGVMYYEDLGGDTGYSLQFGGPGGNCGN